MERLIELLMLAENHLLSIENRSDQFFLANRFRDLASDLCISVVTGVPMADEDGVLSGL